MRLNSLAPGFLNKHIVLNFLMASQDMSLQLPTLSAALGSMGWQNRTVHCVAYKISLRFSEEKLCHGRPFPGLVMIGAHG